MPEVYSDELRKIISLMMQKDPINRPTPRSILNRKITKEWISKLFPEIPDYADTLIVK